uniref:SUMO specific peptidase 5 n=1 Tax=Sphenodon punctatus TaxID=8508 RepID=A0A8D0H466_SPHPU
MKEHRRKLHRKRSQLLTFPRKWTTGFWGLQKYYFQKKRLSLTKRKRQSAWSTASLKRNKSCRYLQHKRKTFRLRSEQVPEVLVNAKKQQVTIAELSIFPTKASKRLKRPFIKGKTGNSSAGPVGKLDNDSFHGDKLLNKKVTRLQEDPSLGSAWVNGHNAFAQEPCDATFPIKEDGLVHNEESNNDEGGKVIVLNNSKRKCCCRRLEQNGTCGPLTRKRSRFNRRTVKNRSLFMMYKKLSMVRFRCGVLKTLKRRAKGKTCKSNKGKASWVETVTRDCQESLLLQKGFKGGTPCCFPPWKSTSSPLWNLHSSSDMNNNTPGLVGEETRTLPSDSYLTQGAFRCNALPLEEPAPGDENGSIETCELHGSVSLAAETLPEEGTLEAPAVNSCHNDCFILVTEKEIALSGQEDAESNRVLGADEILLESCKAESNANDDFTNGPLSAEQAQNEDCSCQMEVEGALNTDIFGVKLLDHPYCKSPLEEPLPESTGLKSGIQKGARKSSPKASLVTDEQLSTWLCGFLDDVMKKYGSLVPLCEKDVMGRLKEVFNEDFSLRKPFITREIMKYRSRHPKSSTCNFRVFYNKHMLDMDDLATLDGQNWLNDQIINMYGELIMDAVPDKVHFFNSFFHRQLVTKGYNGVKRWTKKVDLFKKTLLLITIHLEVHWSLITVNLPNRIISFYDSQGIHFKFCVENIRKYLLTEAREKNHPEFLQGWQTAVTKCIPQQKNDSDCGVFVLQYCKCLALDQPFQFSQEDMPRVRKRIYKELCERRLID